MSGLFVFNRVSNAVAVLGGVLSVALLGCGGAEEPGETLGQESQALGGTVTLRGNRATVDAAWSAFKTQYVQNVSFCDGATPCKRVNRTNEGNTTVSEGIGYGMLLAAYLNDKTTFDGLWNYYRAPHHLNSRGVMHWKWEATDANSGQNEATDAIEDVALGLIVANRRAWGSPAGTTGSAAYPDGQTYAQHATIVINKIYQFFVAPNASPAGLPMPGDDAFWNNNTWNPSYLMAPYTAIFQTHPNSFTPAQWNGVKNAEYAMLASIDANDASGAAVTGLVPDWNFDSGSTSNICSIINWDTLGDGGCRGGMYSYDACRTPWRLEMDHFWNNDASANSRLTKINNWARPLNGLIVNGYKTNGTQYNADNQYPPGEIKRVLGAFVGPLASASIADTANPAYQQAIWDKLVSLGQIGNYYSDAQRMLALAFVSGSMPNPNDIGGACTPASCASRGASCGSISDGCGGVVTCATCGSGVCDQNNTCCTPNGCPVGSCSTVSDGCGGTLNCGSCGAGLTCLNSACLGLPAGWSSQDVGAVAAVGNAYESGGNYTVIGSGVDIFGTSDEFRFAYKSMTGDGTVIAHLTGVSNTSMWSKGGIMIRETLAPDSKMAYVLQWSGRQLDFQWRSTTGGNGAQLASQIASPNFRWLKLVRSGNTFSAFYSDNGTTYTQAGTTQTISMASSVFVGLAATSHNDGTLCTTTYDNVTMPSPPNISPTTSITSPESGATFTAPATISINANASDSDGTISKVEFYQGTTLLGTDTTAPFGFDWTDVPAGNYSLTSKTYDNLNATGTSSAVSITVNEPPTTSITSPPSGATFTAPATISISADASDSDGTIGKVEFYQGTTLLGTDTTAPFGFDWTDVPAGNYSFTSKTYDNLNATGTSSAVSITVNEPPTTSITSPPSGATFTAPATISISADASDSDGTISKVEFYQGTTLLGTDTTAPFGFDWTNVPAGNYSLTSKTYDNLNATGTSSAVSITVNEPPTTSITSPPSGATFTAPATISISADASDSDGAISKVEFYQGTTLLGTDTTAPFGFDWTNVPGGAYALTSKAYDNLNATGTSSTVPIAVNAPPTTSITSPASGATFTAPATVTISANASDGDGTISKVEFYQGTTLLDTDTTAPFGFDWTNVPAGSYSLTSKAYDNLNATGTSSAVPITVNPCTLPAAPTSPRATAGKGRATLSWSSVSGATSYTLRRSTTSGGPYTNVATGLTSTSTVNASLTNGTTYFYVVAAVNGCGTGPNSSQVSATPDASLLLHYLFNETSGTVASDSSGNGLNATLSGATFVTGGHNGNCVDINGGTQRVNLPANVVQTCTDITLAARVRLDTNGSNWARIFDVGTGTATNMFLTPRGGASNVLRFGFKINNATEQQISATFTFPTATWKHVAVTLLGNTGTLYLDGAQVGQNTNLTNNPSGMGATVNNFLGDSNYSADPTLDGRLDDFRISCRAYSASEIAALVP